MSLKSYQKERTECEIRYSRMHFDSILIDIMIQVPMGILSVGQIATLSFTSYSPGSKRITRDVGRNV